METYRRLKDCLRTSDYHSPQQEFHLFFGERAKLVCVWLKATASCSLFTCASPRESAIRSTFGRKAFAMLQLFLAGRASASSGIAL
jgi:hypothetical protein